MKHLVNKNFMSFKAKRVLLGLGAFASASFIALASAATLAAYLDLTTYNASVNYQTENVGTTYFGGGEGTSAQPFLISTPTHLRNLQKLTSLGLFTTNTVFNMTADITWDSTPLLPIGSDDMPFYGTFDGKGHKITSLIVNGYQTWDIGMFGYVAISGTIKNFILDKPTIYVGANTDGGNADSTNPLYSKLKTAAQQLPIPSSTSSGTGYISWTNGTNSATLAGLPDSITDNAGLSYAIVWESSDASKLSYDNGAWTTHATSTSEYPETDLYPVMLTARVFAETNGKVSSYALERYEINILGNGKITAAKTSIVNADTGTSVEVQTGMFKTLWPLDTAGAATTYHGVYVGFFCGHLDGYAIYLGLVGGNSYDTASNAKIIVNGRAVSSKTSLIGHCRGDDVRDGTGSNQYGHTFDFGKDVTSFSYNACAKPYNGTYYYRYNSSTSSSYFNGNMARQISQSNDLTKAYLKLPSGSIDTETYKYMRIYPTASKNTGLDYTYTNGDGTTETITDATALHFSEPLSGAVDTLYRDWFYDIDNIPDRDGNQTVDEKDIIKSDDYNHKLTFASYWSDYLTDLNSTLYTVNMNVPVGYCVNNGFWVYTKGDSADLVNTITGKNTFKLNFTINYVATTSSANKSKYDWEILYNANNQDVHKYQPIYSTSEYYYGFYYKDAAMQNVLWYDLHDPYKYNDALGRFASLGESKYTPVPIVADGALHTANVTITVDRNDANFWSAYYENYFASDTWYPCFAIGPGYSGSLTHKKATSFTNASTITNTNWSNYYSVWKGPFTPSAPEYQTNTTKSQRGLDGDDLEASQFYNSYFQFDGTDTLDVNVISFSSIFTNANGNVASTMNNVDYLYDASACTFDTTTDTTSATYDAFSVWNRASDVKVGFDVTTALATGNATYYYYREQGNDGFGATVHADYTNASYVPTNATGYTQATFTKR